jgi:anti-sigma B factor antagonist
MAPDKSERTPPPERGTVEVEIHPQPGVAIVAVRGEHDLLTKAELAEALERAGAQRNVLVDLSECSFMDSSVVAALFVASKTLEQRDGRLELVIPPQAHMLQRVANIAGLAGSVPIHETRSAGVASIQPRE